MERSILTDPPRRIHKCGKSSRNMLQGVHKRPIDFICVQKGWLEKRKHAILSMCILLDAPCIFDRRQKER